MKIGIIGGGSIGSRHAANARALGYTPLIYDESADRAMASWDDVVHQAEAVMICTPAATHAGVARQLLAAGYHGALFVEKPLALVSEDCAVFRNWPHPTGAVGYNWRFHPDVRAFRQLLGADFTVNVWLWSNVNNWPGAAYADPVLECSHSVDLACHWLGDGPVDIARGATVSANSAYLGLCRRGMFQRECRVYMNFRAKQDGVREFNGTDGHGTTWHMWPSERGLEQSYVAELKHFLDCAQRGVPTEVPFADGIRVLDVIAQAQELAACPKS